MLRNSISTAIILICFSAFSHSYANITAENIKDTDSFKNESRIYSDTTEVAKKGKSKKKKYKASITLINQTEKIKGFLYKVNDSSVVVSSSSELLTEEFTASLNNAIDIANIKKIKLRKKGNVGKGYIIGTSIGIALGVVAGVSVADGDGFPILASAGMLGIVGSVVGTGIGSISGTKRYTIEGSQETFLLYQEELKTLSLVGE